MSKSELIAKAQRSLSRRDPILRKIIRLATPFPEKPLITDYFTALVRSIVAQQISTKAANSIFDRLSNEVCDTKLTPSRIVQTEFDTLRSAGLSKAKALSIQDLAQRVVEGQLNLKQIDTFEDEEIISQLLPVRGIGRWTAQMFLIFSLGRLNVLPVNDLGIQTAVKNLYELEKLATANEIQEKAKKWSPYCSVASWYLWRSLELEKTELP